MNKLELEQTINLMKLRSRNNKVGGKINAIMKNTNSYFEKKLQVKPTKEKE